MPLVTALPTPPSRANPATFSADADVFLAALSQFATEVNAVGQAVVVGPMAVAGGTADAITANFTPDIALTNGQTVLIRAGYANATTTPTFSPDGLTAHTIVRGANQALVAGDIAGAGHWLQLQYDSTLTAWVLQNPATALIAASCTGNAATASSLNSQAFASNAEARAFSVTNKAISPATLATALGGANQSIAASGYQKLPGGLIIQWGSYTSSIPSQSSVTITLPTAFPNAIFIVIPTPTGSIDYSSDNAGFSTTAKSTTQFTAKSQADNAMGGMDWISIGY